MLSVLIASAIDNLGPEVDAEPGIDESISYIEWLIIWYTKKPSPFLANIIVSRLEALSLRIAEDEPGAHDKAEWACARLARNWEYIASRLRNGT